MKKFTVAVVVAFLSTSAVSITPAFSAIAASARTQVSTPSDYIFDIVKKNPKLLSAWKWIVPKSFSNVKAFYKDGSSSPWIVNLDGTAAPVDRILLNGKKFILGSMCWPHNCGGNHVVFLIAVDGSESYGLVSSETLKVPEQYFGRPNGELTKLMKTEMKDQLNEYNEYFTTYK
jgi:hypothetical protein